MFTVGPGDVISDRYEVERELGKGGMATVYQVRHKELKSRHALKLLDISSSSVRKRLLQEGRIQASLAHPNIVAVTDVLDVEGSPGLVMEFVDGLTLTDQMERQRPTPAEAEAWFRAILGAVGYAHSRGLVHRDLKPDNVMMAKLDDGLLPKVADFGIAKVLGEVGPDQPGTRAGLAMGTPAYMPPEQVNSAKDADQRADVFALGCILYELMCGQRAFDSENVLSVFTAVLKGDFTPPGELVPGLEPRIVTAIERALDPDRTTRTQTVSEFIAILDARLVPVAPKSPSPPPPAAPVHHDGPPFLVMGTVLGSILFVAVMGATSLAAGVGAGWLGFAFTHQPDPAPPDAPTIEAAPLVAPSPVAPILPQPVIPQQPMPTSDEFTLAITGWHQADRVRNGVLKHAYEDGRLLIVQVELTNLTTVELDLGFPWALIGPDGTEYDAPLSCHMSLENSINPMGDLPANTTWKGPLCFDGPVDVTGSRIRFDLDTYQERWFPL